MKTLEFIFYLGIILIVFRFIWWCFSVILFLIRGGNQKSKFEEYALKLLAYFLTVSISARYITEFSASEPQSTFYLYSLLAGFILLMYFVRKLQKRQFMAAVSSAFGGMVKRAQENIDPKIEWTVISLSMGYFVACLIWPSITDNIVNNWLKETISDFYHVPLIGWIIKLLGIFFLIGIIFRGIHALMSLLTGKEPQGQFESYSSFNYGSNSGTQDDEDRFDDFEDVTDDEEDNKGIDSDTKG